MFDVHDIGDYDKRIQLIKVLSERDSTYNQVKKVEQVVATVWARLKNVSTGGEDFKAKQEKGDIKQGFEIKYSSDWSAINETWKIKWGGIYYEITKVFNDRRRGYIVIDTVRRKITEIEET